MADCKIPPFKNMTTAEYLRELQRVELENVTKGNLDCARKIRQRSDKIASRLAETRHTSMIPVRDFAKMFGGRF